MEIKKDESGNTWIDGELCINVPVKVKHINELHQQAKVSHSYDNAVELVNDGIYYYLYGLEYIKEY